MRRWFDDLAMGWLQRRGYMVMAMPFIGVVIGNGVGRWRDTGDGVEYVIYLPNGHRRIVCTNTVLMRDEST